ncbi:MAG: hypothetical protein J0M08_09230 [Bacteroidetes bacterium]|nr:hypothetical protein [Bacteroidota bacterium]
MLPNPHTEQKAVKLFLLACTILLVVFSFLSEGTYESGDSIQHFLISKYSFQHPELFLHHWGKPLFTILSAPLAQFGFVGINIFNIACAIATAWFCYLIAVQLKLANAFLVPLFSLCAPIYFVSIISGLTEMLFAFLLVVSIYFVIKQRPNTSAILVSFLPFVRSEGFLLIPIFAIYFVFHKKWKSLFLLPLGTLLFSLAGFLYHYHDIFWILNSNPYKGAADIYGSGTLTHFISKNEFIFGTPQVVLIVAGVVSMFFLSFKQVVTSPIYNHHRLIYACFLVYFIAHSVFWWKGIHSSLGLIRVIAGVTPLLSLAALQGFNFIITPLSFLKKRGVERGFYYLLLFVVICTTLWMPFKQHNFPKQLNYEDQVVKQAADWFKKTELIHARSYYIHPYWSYFTNKDPFDATQNIWSVRENDFLQKIKVGELFIWDSHYSPAEGHFRLQVLLESKQFEQVNYFNSGNAPRPKDKELFELYVFKRVE